MGTDTLFPERMTRVSFASVLPTGPDRPCLVVIAGKELGQRIDLVGEEVQIGRAEHVHLTINSDLVSRHHATVLTAGDKHVLRDESSTNGSFVNDKRVQGSQELVDGDQIKIGRTVIKYTRSPLEVGYLEQVMVLATHDALTGVFNKRRFDEAFPTEVGRAAGNGTPISLILFDIDFFKRINDGFGHPAGDAVLRELTQVAKSCVADVDLLARVGGEEFAVLLPSPLESAAATAERIRQSVEAHAFVWDGKTIPVTVSLGVGELGQGETAAGLYGRADELLYASKHGGRNRVSR
ncbi:MAG TPA: GGDEF domain-containing protein [Polyangiaceae bacterium]